MMKPIAIDDFCAVRSLANVTFSPEGSSACFTVSQAKKGKELLRIAPVSSEGRRGPSADRRRERIFFLLSGRKHRPLRRRPRGRKRAVAFEPVL